MMPGLLDGRKRIYYSMGSNADFDQQVQHWRNAVAANVRAGARAPAELVAVDQILHEQRLCKDKHEIENMRRAANISAAAHCRAMQVCRPGMWEYEIEAELLHEFTRQGSRAPAYSSIVGGGKNACVLHYVENNARLRNGDLLLIDAGAEYDCYASDITRTFPVNGRFTAEQRAVYEVVLAAQRAAINKVKPGNHWNQPHEAAVRVLTRGLVKLGILKGKVADLVKRQAYARFYMHRTGHWLGMDVHDVGDYRVDGKWRPFRSGMVLTVEPGLYIPAKSKGVDRKWWNIGIRIEDDVLVTRNGCEVLTDGVPKTPVEIETLMAGGKSQ
jgi:Xaa-Pro aminopeptidase